MVPVAYKTEKKSELIEATDSRASLEGDAVHVHKEAICFSAFMNL